MKDYSYTGYYCWRHLPTGKTGADQQHFIDRRQFLEAMARWNQDGRWKYWERP